MISKNKKTVDEFEEKPLNPRSTLVSTWAYIFPKQNLKDIIFYAKENNDDLWGIFEYLIQKNQTIDIFVFEELWFDVWSFQWYIDSHKLLQKNKKIISEKSSVKNCKLLWAVSISEWCVIEESVLDNVIVFPNVKIKNAEIRNSIIDENVEINWIDISSKIIRNNSSIVEK